MSSVEQVIVVDDDSLINVSVCHVIIYIIE